jgi:AcrR family transcriptional regulator
VGRPRRQRERRAELVEAARRAVIEQGVLGLRLTEVAKRAGLAPASVLYYYPALTDLLREVQDQAVARFCAARDEASRAESDPSRRLLAMIHSGLPSGPDDELCRLLYELGTVARRDPAYAARYVDLFGRQVALYLGILEAGAAVGQFQLVAPSAVIARNLVVLEDGYGLHMTMAVPTVDPHTALRGLLSYASAATGRDLTADPSRGPADNPGRDLTGELGSEVAR